jgi:putative hydrolase of the HAD superfamily
MGSSGPNGPPTPPYPCGMDAVLLDLYDTVARTQWGQLSDRVAAALGVEKRQLFSAYDLTRSARAVGAYGSPEGDMTAIVRATGIDPSPGLIRELLSMEREFSETGIELWDDSLPVVRALRQRGVKTALISNCSHSTRRIVDRLGIEMEFDAILLSFEVGLRKPDPEIYREALRRVDVSPVDAIFVDDQPAYCDGAAALGIGTFLIVRRTEEPPTGPDAGVDGHRVITDLYPLLEER